VKGGELLELTLHAEPQHGGGPLREESARTLEAE
jgi:hypothetical protein